LEEAKEREKDLRALCHFLNLFSLHNSSVYIEYIDWRVTNEIFMYMRIQIPNYDARKEKHKKIAEQTPYFSHRHQYHSPQKASLSVISHARIQFSHSNSTLTNKKV